MAEPNAEPTPQPNGNASKAPEPAAEPNAAAQELAALKAKIGPNLSEYLSRADGDSIANALSEYLRYQSDPNIRTAIERVTKGGVPVTDHVEDEYLSPEQKEIRELRAEIGKLRSGHDDLTLASGQQALEGHIKRFISDYPLEPNEVDAVRTHLQKTFQSWMREGETGRRALQNIQNPQNYNMVENLLITALKEASRETLFALGERRDRRKRGRLEDFRTDEPSQTAGREEPIPEFKAGNAAMNALAALEWAEAHDDRLRRIYRDS